MRRLNPFYADTYEQTLQEIIEIREPVAEEAYLVRFNDNQQALTKRCPERREARYVQLANYTDNGRIIYNRVVVDNDSWFPVKERVGLFSHESVYRHLRGSAAQDTDSRRAVKLNSYVFSDMSLTPVDEGLPQDFSFCTDTSDINSGTAFFVFDYGEGSRLQFITINGMPLIDKTIMNLPHRIFDRDSSGGYAESRFNIEPHNPEGKQRFDLHVITAANRAIMRLESPASSDLMISPNHYLHFRGQDPITGYWFGSFGSVNGSDQNNPVACVPSSDELKSFLGYR